MTRLEMSAAELMPRIRTSSIFRYLSDGECLDLVNKGIVTRYEAKERFITEGEESPTFYVVVGGIVNITVQERTGKEVFICAIGEGDVIGEAAIFMNRPRTANAIAAEPTILLEFTRDRLLGFLRNNPTAGLKILMIVIHSLLNKLRDANQELAFERKAAYKQSEVDDLINSYFGNQ